MERTNGEIPPEIRELEILPAWAEAVRRTGVCSYFSLSNTYHFAAKQALDFVPDPGLPQVSLRALLLRQSTAVRATPEILPFATKRISSLNWSKAPYSSFQLDGTPSSAAA